MTTLSELKELCEKATPGKKELVLSNGAEYDIGARPVRFYAYPASLEKMDKHCDLGDNCNITVNMYPHTEYQRDKYNLIPFIEKTAATDPETVLKLIETIEKQLEALEFYGDPTINDRERMLVLSDKARDDLYETDHSRFTFGKRARQALEWVKEKWAE